MKSKGECLGWMKESDIKKRKINLEKVKGVKVKPIENEYKLVK